MRIVDIRNKEEYKKICDILRTKKKFRHKIMELKPWSEIEYGAMVVIGDNLIISTGADEKTILGRDFIKENGI